MTKSSTFKSRLKAQDAADRKLLAPKVKPTNTQVAQLLDTLITKKGTD